MNSSQMEYLYMYGSKYQVETVKELANLAVEVSDASLQDDLFGLIRWIMQYTEKESYSVFFLEFCKATDKEVNEISTKEAITFQEGTYEVENGRLSIRLTAPYSQERIREASAYAKKHGLNSRD